MNTRTRSFAALVLAAAAAASADDPKPAASPKTAESYGIKVGSTIFTDFTYQEAPKVLDGDKNPVHKSEFEVRRAYINVVGTFSDLFTVRCTPTSPRGCRRRARACRPTPGSPPVSTAASCSG
jgi:hypothetical protein